MPVWKALKHTTYGRYMKSGEDSGRPNSQGSGGNGSNPHTAGGMAGAIARNSQSFGRTTSSNAKKALLKNASPALKADLVHVSNGNGHGEEWAKRRSPGQDSTASSGPRPPEAMTWDGAATRVARMWIRKRYTKFMDKQIFQDRLELEDAVSKGVLRLGLYGLVFMCIVLCLGIGITQNQQLVQRKLLAAALDTDTWLGLQTLDDVRDFLPAISDAVKRFSVSSSERFSASDGTVILQERIELQKPRPLFTFDPPITHPAFTLTAWVERLSGSAGDKFIIRKPMDSDPSLNCWAWQYPAALKFGAHDFHTLDTSGSIAQEEVMLEGLPDPIGEPVHCAVTVENRTVQFYRNGKPVGEPQQLRRDITDCVNPATIELGAEGIAMFALKFYPRRLNPSEVAEMFEGGQPLVEVATGSVLDIVEEEPLLQVGSEVTEGNVAVIEEVQAARTEAQVAAVLASTAEDNGIEIEFDPLLPPESSPPAALPKGASMAGKLPAHERTAWEEAGQPTTQPFTGRWDEDPVIGGDYWSVFEDPVHVDGSSVTERLPVWDSTAQGMSFSFWFKPHQDTQGHGPHLQIVREEQGNQPRIKVDLIVQLDWVTIQMEVGGDSFVSWRYMTSFDETSGQVNEKFLLYAFAREPEPVTWRHLVYCYSRNSRAVSFFLDGQRVMDTLDETPPKFLAQSLANTYLIPEIFTNATIIPHSWEKGGEFAAVPGKMAQLRLYPRYLSVREIEMIHNSATWPSGDAIRQCLDPRTDFSFFDTREVDAKGHSCAWFAETAKIHPAVCRPFWAKNMCPVTCSGRRTCHDGTIRASFTPPTPRRRFRVFDRIVHLKPRAGREAVICPSDRLDRQQLLQSCQDFGALHQQTGFYTSDTWNGNFSRLFNRRFPIINRTDLRDCGQLLDTIDEEQCSWNSSWLDDFKTDFEETKSWALEFWVHPKEGSLGMPTNFWFSVNLYSELSPPLVLADWSEIEPKLEPWMDTHTVVWDGKKTQASRATIWPTTVVDYTEWTFMYMHFQQKTDPVTGEPTYELCATLNAMPLACSTVVGPNLFRPEAFLQAIEFSTEMLVSPIEVTTETLAPAEIQSKYYRKQAQMANVQGPAQAESERLQERSTIPTKDLANYDQGVVLVAPSLVFQTRARKAGCDAQVTRPILSAQLDLMDVAHCDNVDCQGLEKASQIVTCRREVEIQPFFGLERTTLGGIDGYAEFLSVVADNPVVVRDGEILDTRVFLDAQSTSCQVIALFHAPSSGLTTEVILHADMSEQVVETSAQFRHYGFVSDEKRTQLLAWYSVLFTLLFLGTVLSGFILVHYWFASKQRRLTEKNVAAVISALTDIVFCLGIMVVCFIAFLYQLNSQKEATEILEEIASVPFAQPDLDLTEKAARFFKALDKFNDALSSVDRITTAAFALQVLMLLRIIDATAVHPRTRVLVGTLLHALNDLWHFTILFMVVFYFFSFTANYMFGSERADFASIEAAMLTQYETLLGELPEAFEEDARMIVYVTLTSIVMFFLMLNFLLAIVVEGYMKVRLDIEENKSEMEFFTDVYLVMKGFCKEHWYGWPGKGRLLQVVQKNIGSSKISQRHLMVQNIPYEQAKSLFNHYYDMENLRTAMPAWLSGVDHYKEAEISHEEWVKQSLERLISDVRVLNRQLNKPAKDSSSPAHDPSAGRTALTVALYEDEERAREEAEREATEGKGIINQVMALVKHTSRESTPVPPTPSRHASRAPAPAPPRSPSVDHDPSSPGGKASVNGNGNGHGLGAEVFDEDLLRALQTEDPAMA